MVFRKLIPRINLGNQHANVRDYISCSTSGVLKEIGQSFDCLLLEGSISGHHLLACLHYELLDLIVRFRLVFDLTVNSLLEDKEWNREELVGSISKGLQCAHETEERLHLALGELPMLTEEIEREDAREVLTTSTDGQLPLLLEVEATSCILVHLQVEDG